MNWERILSVRASEAGSEGPPHLGRYAAAAGKLSFFPRFPATAGLTYRISFDGKAFDELAESGERTRSLEATVSVPAAGGVP